jgi:hypothetical protein
VQLEGAASAPQQLEQGDFVIFPHGHGHVISDAPGRAHRPAAEVYGGQPEGVVRIGGKGHVTEFICGDFTFEGARGHPLLEALPDMLHVKRPVPDGWREMVSRLLLHEVRNQQLGTDALISRLVELLFVQSVRSWLESAPEGAGGRLGALRDPVVRETVRRMHSDPVRACSVAALAAEARVSRSTLAGKFRAANDRVCRVRDWESNSVEAP